MAMQLDKLDPVPFVGDEVPRFFFMWLTVVIDTLNNALIDLENFVNLPVIPSYTQAEIVAAGPDAEDGTMWYASDSVPPNVVIKIDGSLRQLTTAAFP